MEIKIKRIIAILLALCFLVSLTDTVVSAASFTVAREKDSYTAAFTDTSQESKSFFRSWSWNFGDGSTSNDQNPIHRFKERGTYTVTLKIGYGRMHKKTSSVTQDIRVPLKKK